MTAPIQESFKLPPQRIVETLRKLPEALQMDSGDASGQQLTLTARTITDNVAIYQYLQFFPEKMLKEIILTITFIPQGEGSGITITGNMTRYEAPPGRQHQIEMDIKFDLTTTWTYLKNRITQETSQGKPESADRNYNAGMKELFIMLKNPVLLSPAYFVIVEQDEVRGFVKFQDPTGSLNYTVERLEYFEPDRIIYHVESNTSNMYTRSGTVEITIESVNLTKSKLHLRAAPEPTKLSKQMEMSSMYLQPEQLQAYLSFKQDLQMLLGWIDAAVVQQIPHIRDMVIVQGDFVAGSKVDIRDSVLNKTNIEIGKVPDDGRFLVHSDKTVESKVTITDSVVNRSNVDASKANVDGSVVNRSTIDKPVDMKNDVMSRDKTTAQPAMDNKNVEVYMKSLEAAFQDGIIDNSEAMMLETLQKAFDITPEQHLGVMEALGVLKGEQVEKYAQILQTTLTDQKIDSSEEAILNTLRTQFKIPMIIQQALVTKLMKK